VLTPLIVVARSRGKAESLTKVLGSALFAVLIAVRVAVVVTVLVVVLVVFLAAGQEHEMDRRKPGRIPRLRACAVCHQPLCRLEHPAGAREVERRVAILVLGSEIRAMRMQVLEDLIADDGVHGLKIVRAPPFLSDRPRSPMGGSPTILICAVDRETTFLMQPAHHLDAPLARRYHEAILAGQVPCGAQVSTSLLEPRQHADAVVDARREERRRAAVRECVDRRAMRVQELRDAHVSIRTRHQEG